MPRRSLTAGKHKLNILSLATEDGHVTTLSVVKHLGLPLENALRRLRYYTEMGWLRAIPARLKPKDPTKRIHYIVDHEITETGRLELERLRRMFG